MKSALKYAVLGLAPIVLIIGIVYALNSGGTKMASSVEYFNVLTGERERVSIENAGASVRKDDQGRKVLFRLETNDAGDEFIIGRDRIVLTRQIDDGTLSPEDLKLDISTFQIEG